MLLRVSHIEAKRRAVSIDGGCATGLGKGHILPRHCATTRQNDPVQRVCNRIRLVGIQSIHIGAVGEIRSDGNPGRGKRRDRGRLPRHGTERSIAADRLRVCRQVGRGIEVAQLSVDVIWLAEVAVAYTEVKRQPARGSPVVLSEDFNEVLVDVRGQIRGALRETIVRIADHEVRKLRVEWAGDDGAGR